MRPLASGRPLVLVTASAVLVLTGGVLPAVADEIAPPSQSEVDAAKAAADDKARTVAAVQADLVTANQRVQDAAIAVAQAYEAWNAATWDLAQAQRDAKAAERRAGTAAKALAKQEVAYGAMLAATYEMSPDVTALSALAAEDGFEGVVETSNTMYGLTSSMDAMKQSYRAAVAVAEVATDQADRARGRAEDLAETAAAARDSARALEADAAAEAASVARERDTLIRELATLQDISVALAARRQADLEAAAQARAAAAAEAEAAAQAVAETPADATPGPLTQAAPQQEQEPAPEQEPPPEQEPAPEPQPDPEPEPAPEPDPEPAPEPEPDPTPPPSSGTAAQKAISFARQQLGERYSWGATGPNSWDCSGLTMRSWEHAGKWIGRTSRDQYARATRIRQSQLRPGDLLFWTNGGGSGIYHVAMYTGKGMMIHAPNSSRPVVEESMYSWPPQLYGRP